MAANKAIKEFLRRSLFRHETRKNGHHMSESSKNALSTLTHMLERSVGEGEGNSVIVSGPNGAGKTWVVKKALESLRAKVEMKNNFIVVNLNGMVHTDDRYALLEIARQLNLASQLEDKISLSFAAALDHLLETIRSGTRESKCIVFILEEFDLFAKHKNQTLLYNLFDLAQSPVNPIAVIGVTSSLDFIDLLEKRVKSRFSHRIIYLFPDNTFEDYVKLFKVLLEVPNSVSNSRQWNKHITELSKDKYVLSLLRTIFNCSADVKSLKLLLGYAVSQLLTNGCGNLSHQTLREGLSLCSFSGDSKIPLIHGLSVLELSVLVASRHATELNQCEPINFEMIFDEYSKFVSRQTHTTESLSKAIVQKAFDKLVMLELLCPVTSTMSEYQPVSLTLDYSQLAEGVKSYKHCPTYLTYWVEKEPVK